MSAIATQFDFLSGFDFTSLASATQAQIMQAINQIAPLSNIGGVLVFSHGSDTPGSETYPGVINNPRFKRYIWIDIKNSPPTMKIHDQSGGDTYANWVSATLADGSVTNAKLESAGGSGVLGIQSNKLSVTNPAGGTWTARWICRISAAGTAVEFCNPNAIFNASELPRSAIDVTGAPAGTSFLKRDASGGITSWAKPTFADIDTASLLGIDRINPSGTNGQVLATIGGVNVWDEIQDILADGALPITKLAQGAGAALQTIRRNAGNTAFEFCGLPLTLEQDLVDSGALSTRFPLGASTIQTITHSLGVRPRIVFPVIRCTTDDAATSGYIVGDEIPFWGWYDNTAGNQGGRPAFSVGAWTTTNIVVIGANIAALRHIYHKTTGLPVAPTDANWTVKLYLYA